MKIAVSSTGKDLESLIDERFGRCRYFLIVDTDDLKVEAVANENAALSGSAGIQSAAFVASKGVEAVLTGNCGPKAMQVFNETKTRVIVNQSGVVRDAVEAFNRGLLNPAEEGNVPQKAGMGSGPLDTGAGGGPSGAGRGMGRGMGGGGRGMGGGGRGMGMGGGRGMGRRCRTPDPAPSSANRTKTDELTQLRAQADQLQRQMDAIQNRIETLSKDR